MKRYRDRLPDAHRIDDADLDRYRGASDGVRSRHSRSGHPGHSKHHDATLDMASRHTEMLVRRSANYKERAEKANLSAEQLSTFNSLLE